ncbi:MAG: CpaF family protein [Acidimicrobiales bacterium]
MGTETTVSDLHEMILSEELSSDEAAVREVVRSRHPLVAAAAVDEMVSLVIARVEGLGALDQLLEDPRVSDVLVNGPGRVWVERHGRLVRSHVSLSESEIDHAIQRIVGPLGIRADRRRPLVDARLRDGSRVHVVLAPLAVDGPYLAIRRFGAVRPALSDWCPEPAAELLKWMVQVKWNLLVSGATGAGKTTMLNSLAAHIVPDERVITVEDAAELRLPGEQVVRLESRLASSEGTGEVGIRELLRNALRMRPDRLIVGEIRGAEALDLLQALNTGHDGSMSTVHANSPADALTRVETLAMFAPEDIPLAAIRGQVHSALDAVVHVGRGADGRRELLAVEELLDSGQTRVLYELGQACEAPTRRPRWSVGGESRSGSRCSVPWP